MAISALGPATSLRLTPGSTLRLLSFYPKSNPSNLPGILKTITKPHAIPPKFHHLLQLSGLPCRRFFRSVISGALQSSESAKVEKKGEIGNRVGEFRRKLKIADIKGGPDEGLDRVGKTIIVMGWVRTLRVQSSVTFIEVNDGSCLSNLQCVMDLEAEGYDQVESGLVTTGASIWMQGTVVKSQGSKQKVELKVIKIVGVGKSDPSYPIQKKRVSREFLRTKAHLRPRTNTFGAVARVRNALAYATHKFFQENGFVWVSSPIITASDCEGAGEQFCVTTLIPGSLEAANSPVDGIPKTKDGLIDWSQDFFGKPAFLTVSGQLNAETYATALSDVYTFGPTFRAENSNTSRHLAEFWDVAEKDFVQLTYTDAIELLLKAKKKFEFPLEWGCDLQSEHERYITEEVFGGCPVIIRDYPKDIKAFYMRQNDDGKTVAAMDMLVPRVGELIGGSQREERLEYIEDRLDELKLNRESFWWYLDLRRYGSDFGSEHFISVLKFSKFLETSMKYGKQIDLLQYPQVVENLPNMHCSDLFCFDIVALLTEMRPVIMVDYGGKLPELQDHLCALVKFCQQESAIFENLRVMVIEDMIYLIHVRGIAEYVKSSLNLEVELFFVNLEEDPPKMVTQAEESNLVTELIRVQKLFSSFFPLNGNSNDLLSHQMLDSVANAESSVNKPATSQSSEFIDLSCCMQDTEITVPTLNGWLLGYPVVYLFSKQHIEDAIYNLSTKYLRIFQIIVSRYASPKKGSQPEELLSFSVPYELSMGGSNEPWAVAFLAQMQTKWAKCKPTWRSLKMEVSECYPQAIVL
ncbi:hypothetical protein H0E87_028665 [Populus deltoides]|uniref:Aminoacyl-transfer RNA synthetases class-II family profile domain-containing protein n=1 Tax=Populus deltoides TaxID=3696 RepID=A0A8T2WSH7_POPDE|nr:hypothetical protein H0E87_028665 [Populus deltoides]